MLFLFLCLGNIVLFLGLIDLYLLVGKLRLLRCDLILLHADTGHGVDDLRIQVINLLLHQILLILQGMDLAVDVIQLVLMIVDVVLQFTHGRCRLYRLRRRFPDGAGGSQRYRCQKKSTHKSSLHVIHFSVSGCFFHKYLILHFPYIRSTPFAKSHLRCLPFAHVVTS